MSTSTMPAPVTVTDLDKGRYTMQYPLEGQLTVADILAASGKSTAESALNVNGRLIQDDDAIVDPGAAVTPVRRPSHA